MSRTATEVMRRPGSSVSDHDTTEPGSGVADAVRNQCSVTTVFDTAAELAEVVAPVSPAGEKAGVVNGVTRPEWKKFETRQARAPLYAASRVISWS